MKFQPHVRTATKENIHWGRICIKLSRVLKSFLERLNMLITTVVWSNLYPSINLTSQCKIDLGASEGILLYVQLALIPWRITSWTKWHTVLTYGLYFTSFIIITSYIKLLLYYFLFPIFWVLSGFNLEAYE